MPLSKIMEDSHVKVRPIIGIYGENELQSRQQLEQIVDIVRSGRFAVVTKTDGTQVSIADTGSTREILFDRGRNRAGVKIASYDPVNVIMNGFSYHAMPHSNEISRLEFKDIKDVEPGQIFAIPNGKVAPQMEILPCFWSKNPSAPSALFLKAATAADVALAFESVGTALEHRACMPLPPQGTPETLELNERT